MALLLLDQGASPHASAKVQVLVTLGEQYLGFWCHFIPCLPLFFLDCLCSFTLFINFSQPHKAVRIILQVNKLAVKKVNIDVETFTISSLIKGQSWQILSLAFTCPVSSVPSPSQPILYHCILTSIQGRLGVNALLSGGSSPVLCHGVTFEV